jgi:hypothetical protein
MKTKVYSYLLLGALLGGPVGLAAGADDEPLAKTPVMREKSVLVSISASVEAVDYAKREMTLKGPLGNTVSFTVDPKVKRLDEIKVGDFVEANYYVSVAAELRKPTPEEEQEPFVVLAAAGKRPPGATPGAGGLRRFKVVTTIEGIDRPTQTITVKGPLGHLVTARVEDPASLPGFRIGEHIIVTYTEALAISLKKTEQPAPADEENPGTDE